MRKHDAHFAGDVLDQFDIGPGRAEQASLGGAEGVLLFDQSFDVWADLADEVKVWIDADADALDRRDRFNQEYQVGGALDGPSAEQLEEVAEHVPEVQLA